MLGKWGQSSFQFRKFHAVPPQMEKVINVLGYAPRGTNARIVFTPTLIGSVITLNVAVKMNSGIHIIVTIPSALGIRMSQNAEARSVERALFSNF